MWTMKTLSLQSLHYLGLKLTRIYPRGVYSSLPKKQWDSDTAWHTLLSVICWGRRGKVLVGGGNLNPESPGRPHGGPAIVITRKALLNMNWWGLPPTFLIQFLIQRGAWDFALLTSSQVMLLVGGTTFSELLVYPPKILGMASLLYLVLVLVLTPVFASRVAFPNQVNLDLLFWQLHQAKNYYSQKPIKHTLYFSSQTGTLDIYSCSGKKKNHFMLWTCINLLVIQGGSHSCLLLLATTPLPAPLRLCADFCRSHFLSQGSQNITCLILCGRVWTRL